MSRHGEDGAAITRRKWLATTGRAAGAAAAGGLLGSAAGLFDGGRPARAQGGSFKLGAVLELSGPASIWGGPQRNSIVMLAEEINAKGGVKGTPIELVVYDNESKETNSLVLAKRLVEQDGVLGIIGAGTTPTTMPMIPYVTQQEVPLISMGSSDRIINPPNERRWVFKTPNNTSDVVAKMLGFLKGRQLTRVAFLSVNNAYGDTGRAEFEKQAPKAGVEVVAWEKFGATDKDMKPQLTKVRSLGPKAIVVWAIPPAASIVAKSAAELGLPGEVQMVHDHGAGSSPAFIQLAAGAAEGTVLVTAKLPVADQLPPTDPQRPLLLAYAKAYEEKYGQPASAIGGMAYDALLLFAKALETSGAHRGRLRDALEATRALVGITGIFTMSPEDHNGLSVKDLEVARVKGGRQVLITG